MNFMFVGADKKYPLKPLLELAGMSMKGLSLHAGRCGTYLQIAERRGGLTWVQADELAVAIGLNPSFIWPEWVEDGLPVTWTPTADRDAWLYEEAAR